MYGILRLCSKRFQNEIKLMKYNNILDFYFVIIMCYFGLVSGAGRNKNGEIYIYEEQVGNTPSTRSNSNTRKDGVTRSNF